MTDQDEHQNSGPLGLPAEAAKKVGSRLSEARSKRKVSVAELARKVRIREHFVMAIESGDWSGLPPGLNGRGLIRLYARELQVKVPELEPTAHLSETNARVEKEEQAHASDVLNRHTIKTVKSTGKAARSTRKRSPKRSVEPLTSAQASQPPGGQTPVTSLDDVVTPSVSDVLGIEWQNPQGEPAKPASEGAVTEAGSSETADEEVIPIVSVGDVLEPSEEPPAEEQPSGDPEATPFSDVPETVPMAPDTPEISALSQATEWNDDPSPSEFSSDDAPKTIAAGLTRGEVLAEESEAVVSARAAPAAESAPRTSAEAPAAGGGRQRKSRTTQISPAWLAAAAVVVVAGVGIYYSSEKEGESISTAERTGLVEIDDSDSVIEPAPKSPVENNVTSSEAASESAESKTSPVAEGGAAETSMAASEASEPAGGEEAGADSSVRVIGAGNSFATLSLSEPVGIQMRADGQVVASGDQAEGTIRLQFEKRAEILVDDGSLVSLEFEGWNHGVLGHEGRRRRLILKATPFPQP